MVKQANVTLATFKMTMVAMETRLAGLELSHLHRFAFHVISPISMKCNMFIWNVFPGSSPLNFYLLISQLHDTTAKTLSVLAVYVVQPLRSFKKLPLIMSKRKTKKCH